MEYQSEAWKDLRNLSIKELQYIKDVLTRDIENPGNRNFHELQRMNYDLEKVHAIINNKTNNTQ